MMFYDYDIEDDDQNDDVVDDDDDDDDDFNKHYKNCCDDDQNDDVVDSDGNCLEWFSLLYRLQNALKHSPCNRFSATGYW